MAVNLIDSSDITVTQTGNNIQLETTVDIAQVESDTSQNTTDIQNIQDGNVYSTSEVDTGKKWIDNKKIYRKVFTFNSLANSSDNTLGTISNLDYVVSLSGIANQSGEKLSLPHSDYRGLEWSYGLLVNNNNVIVRRGSFGTVTGESHVVVEYTKTTN